ncbi:uncharacterized protein C18orf63 [Rhincodon typus]|uniref:uncharacterized protein C18orf63 n=1 Tax=Rhincodon typus TaxID=259920 RepID=UPI00202F8A11|nr:uncharacterized protein C18orf63 [Rhincodon typus]
MDRSHSVPEKMKENFQSLFFISLPDLRKLCGVTVKLNCHDVDARNLQFLTCRELLFQYPEVLAAPGEYKEILMIMSILFYKTGNIQAYVQKQGGKIGIPQRVIPTVLQACLSYSLMAKLAPNWNKVGHLLIHGKDFLSKAEKQNAVVLELNASETQLCISVEASTVRLSQAKVEDFDISAGVLKSFYNRKVAVIPKHFISSEWCYVLPSMKKGQIVSISHEIPPHCPFRSYRDFQKHWKNMYGYNLPEINDDITLYYTVYFKLIGEKLFTYPFCCVRSEPVQFFPRVDLEAVLTSFFSDLKVNFSNLCGLPIKMTNKPYYATNELSISQTVQARPPNLTTKPAFRTALRPVPTVKYVINQSSSVCPINGSQKIVLDNEWKIDLKTGLESSSANTVMQCGSTMRSTDKRGVLSQHSLQCEKSQLAALGTHEQMKVHSTSYNHSSSAYKIIPIFKSKLLQDKRLIGAKSNENINKWDVQFNSTLLTLKSSTAYAETKRPNNMQGKGSRSEKEIILLDISQKQQSIANKRVDKPSAEPAQNTSSGSEISINQGSGIHKSKITAGKMKPEARPFQSFGKNQEQSSMIIQTGAKTRADIVISDGSCTDWNYNMTGNHQHKQVLQMFDLKEPLKQEKQVPPQHLNLKSLTQKNFCDKKAAEKRKYEEKGTDSPPKKPKSKPVIQDVDMAVHVKYNQLSKLNSVTLQSWLKSRGVSVKTRDKKEHLVSKIMEFIKGSTE